MSSALIIGATGATGQHVLRQLLASPHYSRVGEFGRRVTPLEQLDEKDRQKLIQKTIDFEKLDEAGLREQKWDVVFITLGTTKAAAGSMENFVKIDREYVINAARAAHVPEGSQRLVYLCALGANSSSIVPYLKSKGLTEEGLAAVGYSDFISIRPGFLKGAVRQDVRLGEIAAGWITGAMAHISPNVEIHVADLAKSMIKAGHLGSQGLPTRAEATRQGKEGAQFTVIGNKGALGLSKDD